MGIVDRQGGAEKHETGADAGLDIDFDPDDPATVKVHYDLSAWDFEQRAELAEALASNGIPHSWDDEELVVPEAVEEAADAMFEQLESAMGPFPVALGTDEAAVEFGLDEWTDGDRTVLTGSLVESEVPHRWEGSTLFVAADAEETVDDLLDAIEAGELMSADGAGISNDPPENALSDVFLASNKLAKDPFDARSRHVLIDLADEIDAKHPPYALAPRVWAQVVSGVDEIVERIRSDADGDRVDESDDDRREESSDVIGLAQKLREIVRAYV